MECTHGKLCTRLTNGLGCNDTDGLTDIHLRGICEITAIALDADTEL